MAKITISPEEVKNAGTRIIEESASMYRDLTDIQEVINGTKRMFDSEGGDKLRQEFQETAAEFEKLKNFINAYGEFLKGYSKGHLELDQKIEELAAMFSLK